MRLLNFICILIFVTGCSSIQNEETIIDELVGEYQLTPEEALRLKEVAQSLFVDGQKVFIGQPKASIRYNYRDGFDQQRRPVILRRTSNLSRLAGFVDYSPGVIIRPGRPKVASVFLLNVFGTSELVLAEMEQQLLENAGIDPSDFDSNTIAVSNQCALKRAVKNNIIQNTFVYAAYDSSKPEEALRESECLMLGLSYHAGVSNITEYRKIVGLPDDLHPPLGEKVDENYIFDLGFLLGRAELIGLEKKEFLTKLIEGPQEAMRMLHFKRIVPPK